MVSVNFHDLKATSFISTVIQFTQNYKFASEMESLTRDFRKLYLRCSYIFITSPLIDNLTNSLTILIKGKRASVTKGSQVAPGSPYTQD